LYVLHVRVDPKTWEKSINLWEAPQSVKTLLDKGINEMKNKEIQIYDKINIKLKDFFARSEGQTKTAEVKQEKEIKPEDKPKK
jgi:hypothetical protein